MATGKYSSKRTGRFSYSGSIATFFPSDPSFSSVSLLVHGDGPNSGTNSTFLDTSPNTVSITKSGSPLQGTFSPFPLSGAAYGASANGGSAFFSGSVDLLQAASADVAFGTSDFTMECWVYKTVGATGAVMGAMTTDTGATGVTYGAILGFDSAGKLQGSIGNDSSRATATASTVFPLNVWTHIAWVQRTGTMYLYQGGSQVATVSSGGRSCVTTALGVSGFYVGATSNWTFGGFISSARVVKGTAVYTAGFSPSTSPLTSITGTSVLCNFTNAAVFDNAAKVTLTLGGNAQTSTGIAKYGVASMYFDGSSTVAITADGSTGFSFGTGDFTVEMWVYPTTTGAQKILYDSRPTSSNGLYPAIFISTTNTVRYYVNSAFQITGTTAMTTNTWNHVALVRLSGMTTLYLNGVQEGSTYTDSNGYIVGTNRPMIGNDGSTAGANPFAGYIDDLRVTKGVARYTTTFTPPPAPFPNY